MIPTPRVAVYVRVSTTDQNFASQEDTLRDFCGRQGWDRLTWYKEKKSGANIGRAQLGRLMDDTRHGRIDMVLVFKLERFGRSTLHMLQCVEEFKSKGVRFMSATEPIDTGNSTGQLVLEIMAAIASHQRLQSLERSRAGITAARKRGVRLGRPSTMGAQIAKVLKLSKKEKNLSEVARRAGVSRSYVGKILKAAEAAKKKGSK